MTPETMTDGKGNTYPVVKLKDGNLWTAQNWHYDAGYDEYNNGCTLYHHAGANGNLATMTTLGLYYNYKQLIPTIPKGWRLPTEAEWKNLIQLYGAGNQKQAIAALEKGGSSGLDLEIGGWCIPGGNNCGLLKETAFYWSGTPSTKYKGALMVFTIDKRANSIYMVNILDDRCLNARLVKEQPKPKHSGGRGPAKRQF